MRFQAIAIGVSAGGMEALKKILPFLPEDFRLAVMVVQHMKSDSDDFLARFLNEKCNLPVKQADEKEIVKGGHIYIAPPNYHLLIEDDLTFSLSVDEPVNFARPSIDVLFESAAEVYGKGLVGAVLTGANNDGSNGLKKIKSYGGLTIVQAPKTAEARQMPESAIAATEVDHLLPLSAIGPFLAKL